METHRQLAGWSIVRRLPEPEEITIPELTAQATRSILYEVGPSDPLTYFGVSVVTAVAALLASWVPVRRAASVEPVNGLRQA